MAARTAFGQGQGASRYLRLGRAASRLSKSGTQIFEAGSIPGDDPGTQSRLNAHIGPFPGRTLIDWGPENQAWNLRALRRRQRD